MVISPMFFNYYKNCSLICELIINHHPAQGTTTSLENVMKVCADRELFFVNFQLLGVHFETFLRPLLHPGNHGIALLLFQQLR